MAHTPVEKDVVNNFFLVNFLLNFLLVARIPILFFLLARIPVAKGIISPPRKKWYELFSFITGRLLYVVALVNIVLFSLYTVLPCIFCTSTINSYWGTFTQ